MTHALVRVYAPVRDHLDAYAIADHLVPDLMTTPRWIPELEAEALPLQRVFLAEKWLVARLHYGHVDPREAGVGNIVNCGAAMYMAPVGLVNAGRPGGRLRRGPGHRRRAPVLVRAGGGGRVRGGGGRGVHARRDADSVVDRPACPWRRTAPGRRSRRSAKSAARHSGLRVGAASAARGGRALRHGGPRLPRPLPRRPPPLPAARHRGTPHRPGHAAGRRRRLPPHGPRRGQLRPRLRLDRHDGGRDGRRADGASAGPGRVGRSRSPRPAAWTCRPRPAASRRSPARSSPGTPAAAAPTKRRFARLTEAR